jgi:hypothetical protein
VAAGGAMTLRTLRANRDLRDLAAAAEVAPTVEPLTAAR